jgi:hypothetical protein
LQVPPDVIGEASPTKTFLIPSLVLRASQLVTTGSWRATPPMARSKPFDATGPFSPSRLPRYDAFTKSNRWNHAQESRPSFGLILDPSEWTDAHFLRTQFRVFNNSNGTRSPGHDRDRKHAQCLLHVIGTSFTFLSAVGAGSSGFGDCILVRELQLLLRGSRFQGSQALIGGAICCLRSDIDCPQCWFDGNLAFFDGGSVICQFDNVTSGQSYAQDKLAFLEG